MLRHLMLRRTGTLPLPSSFYFPNNQTGLSVRRSGSGVRRVKAAFLSGCEPHPAMLLQPEAIGAVMEATKWLKPSM